MDVHYEQTKINLPTNQKGYDKSETTDKKLSARRTQIFWDDCGDNREYFVVTYDNKSSNATLSTTRTRRTMAVPILVRL